MATLIRHGSYTVDYDRKGDVLYISHGDPRPSESESKDRGILVRYAFGEDSPSAITVIGFRKNHWDRNVKNLGGIVVSYIGGDIIEAVDAVTAATTTWSPR